MTCKTNDFYNPIMALVELGNVHHPAPVPDKDPDESILDDPLTKARRVIVEAEGLDDEQRDKALAAFNAKFDNEGTITEYLTIFANRTIKEVTRNVTTQDAPPQFQPNIVASSQTGETTHILNGHNAEPARHRRSGVLFKRFRPHIQKIKS